MVYYSPAALDRTFAALADPTRRALLARLSEKDSLSVSELAQPLPMSLPAVMKHLDVLSDAGLVTRNKEGRVVSCRLRAEPMREANDWLNRYTALLDRTPRSTRRFSGGRQMATAAAVKPSLTIKRRFNAPPAKVYAAWTDPEKMKRWMGPGEIKTVHAESDPRPGGRYQINMRTPAGEAHDVGGVYREVIANEKLVYTWAWKSTPERESLVTVTFKADGTGTLLTLTHEQFFDEAARDSHRGGWEGALVKLEKYLA